MIPSEPKQHRPYWLWKTKRLFPSRLFAVVIGFACLTVGVLFAGVALNVDGCWPMAIPSLLFFAGFFATFASVFAGPNQDDTQYTAEPQQFDKQYTSEPQQFDKPTFAILILLVGVYSWMLTLAMLFVKNGPQGFKYYVTVAIAVAATLFMKSYGNQVVRKHFGLQGGRNLEINGWQAFYVLLLVVGCGCYFAWLMD